MVIAFTFVATTPIVTVAIITTAMAFHSAFFITSCLNAQDIAPNYSGFLFGIMNSVGATTGFISQFILGEFIAVDVRYLIEHS